MLASPFLVNAADLLWRGTLPRPSPVAAGLGLHHWLADDNGGPMQRMLTLTSSGLLFKVNLLPGDTLASNVPVRRSDARVPVSWLWLDRIMPVWRMLLLRATEQRGAVFKRLAEVSVTETLTQLLNRRGFLGHEP